MNFIFSKMFGVLLLSLVIFGGIWYSYTRNQEVAVTSTVVTSTSTVVSGNATTTSNPQVAYFAGGCFWCMEADFEKIPDVTAISGYTGGHTKNPTYEEVVKETTGHFESVEVRYDANKISYQTLLNYYFAHVNATDEGGMFVDRGESYRSAIFFRNENEKKIIDATITSLNKSDIYDKPLVTIVKPFDVFYKAEEYHQDYHTKNPIRYTYYRGGSGRDDYVKAACAIRTTKGISCYESETLFIKTSTTTQAMNNWKNYQKETDGALQTRLTPLQFNVTQKEGTEKAFENEYYNNHEDGIYVDIISGEPLFSSKDKYESGTGWPSFTTPLPGNHVMEKEDKGFFITRTEVRSTIADSHLGHVFPDGPAPTGTRYCMNSAAMRFIPKADLEKEGYGEYLSLFQ